MLEDTKIISSKTTNLKSSFMTVKTSSSLENQKSVLIIVETTQDTNKIAKDSAAAREK